MKFYHGTTEEKWKLIQNEGVLWGKRNAPSRATWLGIDQDIARRFGGPVILEVEYEPDNNRKDEIGNVHNYWDADCWQLITYEPIPLDKVKRISEFVHKGEESK